jgi:hypothetical protein
VMALFMVTCVGSGIWLLLAGMPITSSLDSLTNTIVAEVRIL